MATPSHTGVTAGYTDALAVLRDALYLREGLQAAANAAIRRSASHPSSQFLVDIDAMTIDAVKANLKDIVACGCKRIEECPLVR